VHGRGKQIFTDFTTTSWVPRGAENPEISGLFHRELKFQVDNTFQLCKVAVRVGNLGLGGILNRADDD